MGGPPATDATKVGLGNYHFTMVGGLSLTVALLFLHLAVFVYKIRGE